MASPGHADPLAELARLVGQDDPFRGVFRPAAAPAEHQDAGQAPRYLRDAPYPAEAEPQHGDAGHDPYHADHGYDPAHAHPDGYPYDPVYDGEGREAYDDHYGAAEAEAYNDDAGFADRGLSAGTAAASTLPDIWAQGGDGAPPIDHGGAPPEVGADRRSSARRPLAVLAAVLVLTGGGLAASFLVKGSSTSGTSVGSAAAGRGAPTIMAATGPTKVKVEEAGATAPEDQDAALLNKNGNVSSGPVKIVSSQEQPVDLGQLPKSSDLADGARPLPAPSPSPFPEPKKVKTFVVHPDGTMLSSDGVPAAAGADALGAALPATPKTASRGGTTPKSVAPPDTIAALAAQPDADAMAVKPARQPASPGARTASAKPNDTADAPAASGGGYGVQLASTPVEADANAAFAKLKKKYPAQLGSLTATVHKAETGDKPVYRVRVGSMSQEEAKALCSQIQGAKGSCFVVHN